MTSGNTFPKNFTKIDDLMLPDHYYLSKDDLCYFLGEYTARKDHSYSYTNSLIWNFKKSMDRRGQPEWRYKAEAILQVAAAFKVALGEGALSGMTFVPIPPSKSKSDPLYDDRLTKMLNAIRPTPKPDIREIIVQQSSADAVHLSSDRPTPEEFANGYKIDESLTMPEPGCIVIVDDVITTGAHFQAAKKVLSECLPAVQIIGLFIARRVPDSSELDDISF